MKETAEEVVVQPFEMRRYLAGVPYSHERPLSTDERTQIWRRLRSPGLLALGTSMLAGTLTFQFAREPILVGLGVLGMVLVPLLVVIAYRPYLMALLHNRLQVFIGVLQPISGGDLVQQHFHKIHPNFAAELNRMVEVLAVGDGRRLWKLEGVEVRSELTQVREVRHAVLPDVPESGERELLPAERMELRRRLLHEVSPITYLVITCVVITLFLATNPRLRAGTYLPQLVPVLIMLVGRNWPKSIAIMRGLLTSLRRGTVTDGRLASGWVWSVNGQPAAWRLSTTSASSGLSDVLAEAGVTPRLPEKHQDV